MSQGRVFSSRPNPLRIIAPYALLMAMVGLLETLLTLNLTDEITESRGFPDRECVALGAANMVSGVFGGMGGCAMIGQTVVNLSSGGRGRLSGVTAGVMILLFVLFLSPLIERIPLSALVIGAMVLISTLMHFIQEARSNRAADALKAMVKIGRASCRERV